MEKPPSTVSSDRKSEKWLLGRFLARGACKPRGYNLRVWELQSIDTDPE